MEVAVVVLVLVLVVVVADVAVVVDCQDWKCKAEWPNKAPHPH